MHTIEPGEFETHRILLLRHTSEDNLEILLGDQGECRALPEVRVSRWKRTAEQLSFAIKNKCGIDAVCITSLQGGSEAISYEIMVPHTAQGEAAGYRWVSVDSIDESEFSDRDDLQSILDASEKLRTISTESSSGTFARLNWFAELERWVEERIQPLGLHLTGRFRQLHAGARFSLVRFETDGPAVWFKAVGEPNLQEFNLTQALSALFPGSLAPLIARRPEWHGWLALEVEGSHLNKTSQPAHWLAAARDLADLQIGAMDNTAKLLDAGARNLRPIALRKRIAPFFQMTEQLMKEQPRVPPSPLSSEDLHELSEQVSNAIDVLAGTNFPSTLGQLDLNPGNLISSAAGTVFLDWAEAFVGHPFLSLEYLVEHFRRTFVGGSGWEDRLRAFYISRWQGVASEGATQAAQEVAPLVAVFACATAHEPWSDPRLLAEPYVGRYLRSLARRMQREASLLFSRRQLCRN